MCKTCHPNQPKLTLKKIQIIRKRAAQNKNPKSEGCTKECAYYQKVIVRKNYFSNQQQNEDEKIKMSKSKKMQMNKCNQT